MAMKNTNTNANTKSLRTAIITALICIALFAVILVGLNHRSKFAKAVEVNTGVTDLETGKKKLEIDGAAGEYVAPAPTNNDGQEGGISIPGWGYISVPKNQTDINVDFPNPDTNEGKYYLSFELKLKDTGEVLYTSGLVPPGKTIQRIKLSRGLNAGTYMAVIHVQPYKMDEAQTATNNADMETNLIVS